MKDQMFLCIFAFNGLASHLTKVYAWKPSYLITSIIWVTIPNFPYNPPIWARTPLKCDCFLPSGYNYVIKRLKNHTHSPRLQPPPPHPLGIPLQLLTSMIYDLTQIGKTIQQKSRYILYC